MLAAACAIAVVLFFSAFFVTITHAQWNESVTGRGNTGVPVNLAFTNKAFAPSGSPPELAVSSTTTTTIDSTTLSALPAACGTNGCRLRVTYDYFVSGGVVGVCYVNDGGAADWDQSQAGTVSNHTPCGFSSISPEQFSSGATPTVTVYIYDSGSANVCGYQSPTFTDATCQSSGIQGYLQVEVIQSN